VLACGAGQDYIDRLQWGFYGGRTAIGFGEMRIDDCQPDCARGRLLPVPAVVALSDVVRCADGRRYYSRLGMTFTQTPPVPLGTPFEIQPSQSCSPA
jgi:hypothetical protein